MLNYSVLNFVQFPNRILYILLALLLMRASGLLAEELRGRVCHAQTRRPLTGVNVTISGQAIGAATDREGVFILQGVFTDSALINFSHVGFRTRKISAAEVRQQALIFLEPIPILFQGVEITGEKKKFQTDLPVDVQVIEQATIQDRAPLNLGDLLRSEAAIQIESTSPGFQSVSIRGCNPDQVIILYDGIPLKSTRTDVGDISWIDLNDIQEIQVIKGSNTAVYGEGGVGGVLNIEPVTTSPYFLTLSGRIGNYALRDGYARLGHTFGPLEAHYSFSLRNADFTGQDFTNDLQTDTRSHNLATTWRIGPVNRFILRAMRTDRDFKAVGANDDTEEQRQLATLQYRGDLPLCRDVVLQAIYRQYSDRNVYFVPTQVHQPQARDITNRIDDQYRGGRLEKTWTYPTWNLNTGLELNTSNFSGRTLWDFVDAAGIDSVNFRQKLKRRGLGSFVVVRVHTETGMVLLPWMDWNWSMRYDHSATSRFNYDETQPWLAPHTNTKKYQAVNYKIGLQLGGKTKQSTYNIFLNNGANSRFPALYDLYLNDVTPSPIYADSSILPERVIGSEIGLSWDRFFPTGTQRLRRLNLKISYFRNDFSDKIYYKPWQYGTPVTLNALHAAIDGYDLNFTLGFSGDKFTLSGGALWLDVSSARLFPNKPDVKFHLEGNFQEKNFNLRLRGFYEGRQLGYTSLPGGGLFFTNLTARADVDLQASYRLRTRHADIWSSLSVMNLLARTDTGLTYSFFDRLRLIQFNVGLGFK